MALAARPRLVLLLLVAGSLALRTVAFLQLNGGPFLQLERWEQTDMHYYDRWGRAIAQGDWRSETIGAPMHEWHYEVAARYLEAHPDVRPDPAQLWAGWNGAHRFYQDPLYAYLIALTYRVRADARLVLAWQLLLGVLSNVLIYLITRRYFGDRAGLIAAAFALLCAPLLYYELLLLRDSTIVFAALLIVWLTDRATTSRHWPPFDSPGTAGLAQDRWFAAAGAAIGLAVLLKSSFLLLAVLWVPAIAVAHRGRGGLSPLLAASAGFALAVAPAAIRNVAVGVPPLAWAGSGALTFVAGNSPSYPVTGGFYVKAPEIAAIMGETDGRFLPAVAGTLALHTPSTFASTIWRKVASTFHWYEIPNNVNFYYLRIQAPLLAWLPFTFFAIAPLGLVGLLLAGFRLRDLWPLYLVVAVTVATLVGFLVLGRLRAPLIAALIPFAAFAIDRVLRVKMADAAGLVVAVVLIGLWTGRPLPPGTTLITPTDWLSPFLSVYKYDVKAAMDAGDGLRAVAAYRQFLRYEPDFSRMPATEGVLREAADRETALAFARIHELCALLIEGTGRPDEGRAEAQRAVLLRKMAGGS